MKKLIFYKDRSEVLECEVKITGAKIKESKARLLLNFGDDITYLFNGNLQENGICKINVPALKNTPFDFGKAVLEVIAESTIFESFTSEFELTTSKIVEVTSVKTKKNKKENKIKVEVSLKDIKSFNPKYKKLAEILLKSFDKNKIKLIENKYKPSSMALKWAQLTFENINSKEAIFCMDKFDRIKNRIKK